MPSQYSSEKKTIGELLSLTSPSTIKVPDWQRNFSWTPIEIETFWHDLIAFSEKYPGETITEQEYFLGSVVLVEQGSILELLDGQQRLATSTILLSVIRDYLKKYRQDAATKLQYRYISELDDATGVAHFKLTMNIYDRKFFKRTIQEDNGHNGDMVPDFGSHKLIVQARDFFSKRIAEKYAQLGDGETAFNWALRLRKVLTDHVSVVSVSSADEDNAASVFETLNDRGIGLSAPDLLRNLLLRRAGNEQARSEIIDCWEGILGIGGETRIKDFIRHYWLSKEGDVKSRSLYREIKGVIEARNILSRELSRDLEAGATLYLAFLNADDDNFDLRRLLKDIVDLDAKVLRPAMLSAYETYKEEGRIRFLKALIALFVRFNVIGQLENNRLENFLFSMARDLRKGLKVDTCIDSMEKFAPPNDEFRKKFLTASASSQRIARYLLKELELDKRKTGEVAVELPDRVHVEHIYPEKPRDGNRLPEHSRIVDRIGNLTLLSGRVNMALQNAPFEEKKERYAEADIMLTKELTDYDKWDLPAIDERQSNLSNRIIDIWNFKN